MDEKTFSVLDRTQARQLLASTLPVYYQWKIMTRACTVLLLLPLKKVFVVRTYFDRKLIGK